MIPINFTKVIREAGGRHADVFSMSVLEQINSEKTNVENISIKACSPESLKLVVKTLLVIVPSEILDLKKPIFTLKARRNPIKQELEIFPLFSADSLLNLMVNSGQIKSFRISTIDENDDFEFNGSQTPVKHSVGKLQSGVLEGAYLEIVVGDETTTVFTINPDEIHEAIELWNERVFGFIKVADSNKELINLILLLRAVKTMMGAMFFTENQTMNDLIMHISELYNQEFTQFSAYKKNRFSISLASASRYLSEQPSEIEKRMKDMPQLVVDPVSKINNVVCISGSSSDSPDFETFGIGNW